MPPQQQEQPAANKFMAFLAWKKMNTKVARQNLSDEEAAWAENLQPVGPNLWLSVNGPANTLTIVTSKTVTRQFPANIGGTDYDIFFATDGSCTAVNANTGAQTTVAGPGSFSTTPDMTTYASQRILIMDPTGGYATWDGTLFVKSGGISPNIHITSGGSGYGAPPTVSFTGGAGGNAGGATATAVLSGGSVVAVNVTNPGTGNAATATIAVVFTGANTTPATATVVIWPQVTGNTIDVFGGRVWWASANATGNYRVLNFTGTGATTGQTFDDTNPADAAGATTILDNDLSHNITAIRNKNNYLYIFGDSSVRQIGSITVSGSITLFTPLTLASDIGTTFLMTIQSYNRLVLFANTSGVYGIFGASVRKISDDLDGIFQLVDFTLPPSSSLNDVHSTLTAGGSIHSYLLLVRYLDPALGPRTIICVYQNDQWYVVSQGNSLLSIMAIFLGSTQQWDTFASSGADVTQLLQTPGANVTILFRSALSSNRDPLKSKRLVRAGVAVTSGIAQTFNFTAETENSANVNPLTAAALVNWVNNAGQQINWQNNSFGTVSFVGGGYRFPYTAAYGEGKVIGGTVSGSVSQFALNAMAFEYVDAAIWGTIP
jgi:hypothetical protein